MVPVNADAEAIAAWVEFAGPKRPSASIIGPSTVVLGMWRQLSDRWGASWREVRNVRPHQPVLAISKDPEVTRIRRRQVTLEHWDSYYEAAVRMYTEEVGVSPVQAIRPGTGSMSGS